MKRLNRKGFTLVELLAVIVILAIVVGITLVTVLPTLKKSRQKAFELTADTAADFVEKQYQLTVVGTLTAGDDIILISEFGDASNPHTMVDDDYVNAGLKAANYSAGSWYIDANGRACVKLTRSTDGEYYDANEDNGFGAGVAASAGCQ